MYFLMAYTDGTSACIMQMDVGLIVSAIRLNFVVDGIPPSHFHTSHIRMNTTEN